MDDRIFQSIVEMTTKRDSDEFSTSIVATLAEIIPESVVSLFYCIEFPRAYYRVVTTLSAIKDQSQTKQYKWDDPLSQNTQKYVNNNFTKLVSLSEFQTPDGMNHIFIPIFLENKIAYAIDIASVEDISSYLSSVLAVTQVCQNFYAILANSEKDSLTGLYNRKTYDQKLDSLLKKQSSKQHQHVNTGEQNEARKLTDQTHTWLAVIDIDFFKKVNDKFGHIYGDEVLLVLSQLMQNSFRQNDLLFRFGGEEFVIIFEPIPKFETEYVLNKFRSLVQNYDFPMIGQVTISCGFAKISEGDHPKTIFDNADKALYYAKENGRNSVYNYEALYEKGFINTDIAEGDIELF